MNNTFFNELSSYKQIVDKTIEDNNFISILIPNECSNLISNYLQAFRNFSIGGKRIRAYLVKLGYELCTGRYDEDILLPSLSYEVFQTGILIHDDIIDKSDMRRNMPTMHVALGNDHTAMSKSICIGDIGLFAAIDMITHSNFDNSIIKKAIYYQIKIFELTVSGELKDIELSTSENYTLEDIIEMYKLKTSWYTIIGPLQLGAILGNGDEVLLSQIEQIGTSMGIAFQIKDDIIGIFGNKNVIGKSNISDMQEGKKTVLTNHFISNATDIQLKTFNEIYGNRTSSEKDLKIIQELFMETQTYEYANLLCQEYANNSAKVINSMNIDIKYKDILNDFLNYLCSRNL